MSRGPLKRLPAAAAASLLLATALPAQAFVRSQIRSSDADSPCLYWPERSVTFHVQQDGSSRLDPADTRATLGRALGSWTDVACSDFVYVAGEPVVSAEVGYARPVLSNPWAAEVSRSNVTLMFRSRSCTTAVPAVDDCRNKENSDCASVHTCWDYGDTVIALTTVSFDSQAGRIFDGDIEFNEVGFTFTTTDGTACRPPPASQTSGCVSTDLQGVATHESGHLLGLGHTAVTDATMFPSARLGETLKRVVGSDDRNGLCTIYPEGLPPQTCGTVAPAPEASGCGCSAGSTAAPVGAWLLGSAALLRRRRRGAPR